MAYNPNDEYQFKEGPQLSLGERLKIATQKSELQSRFTYSAQNALWDEKVNTNGTVTHLSNKDGVELQVGGATNDELVRQSLKYNSYDPGKQTSARFGTIFGVAKTGVRRRAGLYDDEDGLYLEQTGSTLSWVRRTSVTGTAADNSVAQANWNIDTMDGSSDDSNPSGINLDMSKFQLLVIEFKWYGGGPAKVGFEIGGKVYYVHEFSGANSLDEPLFGNPNLPLRYAIKNTGGTGTSETMEKYGATYILDNGQSEKSSYSFTASTTTTTKSITTREPILSIRPKSTLTSGDFDGSTNRGLITPRGFEVFNNGAEPVFFELVYNGTLGSTPSFSSVDNNSITEFDTASTTISGGRILKSGYAESGGKKSSSSVQDFLDNRLDLVVDADGANPIPLTIVCTSVTGSTTDVAATFNFDEQF